MIKICRAFAWITLLALVIPFLAARPASAQNRISDKDLEQRMKNMNEDVKKFRSYFNSSVSKSAIRKTSQEKDAKTLVTNFQKETQNLYNHFKDTKKSDPYLQNCIDMSYQIDKILSKTQFDSNTNSQWAKIQPQLRDIAHAFHLQIN